MRRRAGRTATTLLGVSVLAFTGCGSSDDPGTTSRATTDTTAPALSTTSTGGPATPTATTPAAGGTTTGTTATPPSAGTTTGSTPTTTTASGTGLPVAGQAFRATAPKGWVDTTDEARARIDPATLRGVGFSAFAEADRSTPRGNVSFRDGSSSSFGTGFDARRIAMLTRGQFESKPGYAVRGPLEHVDVDGEAGWVFRVDLRQSRSSGQVAASIRQLVVLHRDRYVQVTVSTGAGKADDSRRLLAGIATSWRWTE